MNKEKLTMKNSFFASLKRKLSKRTLYWQVAFTLLAFAVMVIVSNFIMSTTIRSHLSRNSTAALDLAMAKIDAELRGPETTLRAFAEVVQQSILQGADVDEVRNFLLVFSNHLTYYNKSEASPVTLFGFFYTLSAEPVFLHSNGWKPFDGYDHHSRPWYHAAMAGNGSPVRSEMYLDFSVEQYVFAIAQTIQDESGRQLGVITLQVPISFMGDIVVKTAEERGGYGMILGQDLMVHSHANRSFEGMQVPDPVLPFSIFYDSFIKGEDVFEQPIISFDGKESLAFFRKTQDGWYYGMAVPSAPYYRSITNTWYALLILGAASAVFLILILASTDAKKNRATMLTNTLNKLSEMFLTQSGKSFGEAMSSSGELVAGLAKIDRFSLLRNSTTDGALFMSQIYRW
ncbi:MAG: cache domain-containing protein, partial [Treponema sp.]|nr:cache domain-containing protein [Treponema sp.]